MGMFGALVGALLVLLAHPVTRPYVRSGLWAFGHSPAYRTAPELPQNIAVLPDPTDPATGALWLSEGCRRLLDNQTVTEDNLLTFVEIAQSNAAVETDNAFWPQCEAVFQARLGNFEASERAWIRASKLGTWDDYQNQRILRIVDRLTVESGRTLGWHWALAYSLKTTAVPQSIARFGLNQLEAEGTLEHRFVLLQNGKLLRDGSRSRLGGQFGWQLVESAALGSSTGLGNRRDIVARRFGFIDQLALSGQNDRAIETSRVLASNEAWDAAVQGPERSGLPRRVALQTVLVGALPGALLSSAFWGAIIVLIALLLQRNVQKVPSGPIVPAALGVLGGLAVYAFTGLLFPALFMTLVLAGFLIRPPVSPVESPIIHPDPALLWVSRILGACLAAVVALAAWLAAPPAVNVLPTVPDRPELLPDPAVAGFLCVLLLGSLLAYAQVWAYTRRRDPFAVCAVALKTSGATALIVGLIAGIVACPLAIAADREISVVMMQLVQNEPTYYIQNL